MQFGVVLAFSQPPLPHFGFCSPTQGGSELGSLHIRHIGWYAYSSTSIGLFVPDACDVRCLVSFLWQGPAVIGQSNNHPTAYKQLPQDEMLPSIPEPPLKINSDPQWVVPIQLARSTISLTVHGPPEVPT
jgi:hypothetical protein